MDVVDVGEGSQVEDRVGADGGRDQTFDIADVDGAVLDVRPKGPTELDDADRVAGSHQVVEHMGPAEPGSARHEYSLAREM